MRLLVLIAALLISACASESRAPISYGDYERPAPVRRQEAPVQRSRSQERAPQQVAPAAQPNWAAGPGTPLSAWALQPSANFDPLNPPRTHVMQPRQTLSDVAALYQIPVLTLIDFNHLTPPYALAPGTTLRLPPPRIHVVREDESFEDIARANAVDVHSLAVLNRMQPPYVVRRGDRIVLPNVPGAAPEADDTPQLPARAAQIMTAPTSGGGRFTWPLRGAVVARYGAQANGRRLDGIEIAGHEGDAIAAAADGDVVYVGSDLAGYGTLVLVRHAGNCVTAYGFARRALVREGQRVRAGEEIAELGSRPSGGARLLFQVRQGTQAVDPEPLLRGQAN
jgi:murein DD-endopeptidase MepM/ murein hydrolase activator NlpD